MMQDCGCRIFFVAGFLDGRQIVVTGSGHSCWCICVFKVCIFKVIDGSCLLCLCVRETEVGKKRHLKLAEIYVYKYSCHIRCS